jgi:hypothetical protein
VLKYDNWKDVRIASAIALGEIGTNEAAVALERAAIYDHKEDVRKACTNALGRLNARVKAGVASRPPVGPVGTVAPLPATNTPSPFRRPEPSAPPDAGAPTTDALPQGDLTPPPPPAPVTGSSGNNG